ncbi:hypothetical protein LTR12_016899 [Friedmanniomyces endolithicus]|nr:hypothetical protein LTR12_016899 [Friedmanniomyces endolithicus]
MAEKQPASVEKETTVPRNHASDTEKETPVPAAEIATKDRRKSHMSIEDPSSPTSSSRNSISTESDHERYSHESRGRNRPLAPQLSRTSSTGAIGGIHAVSSLNRTHTNRSVATNGTGSFDPSFEIDFAEGDKGDPQQWPIWYKGLILFVMSYGTTCVVLYSTSYTSAIPGMEATFGVGETVGVLGVTTYLFGMATGSVILAPLSEMFGRRPIYVVALALFVVFVIPCAVAENMATILVTRECSVRSQKVSIWWMLLTQICGLGFFGAFCAAASTYIEGCDPSEESGSLLTLGPIALSDQQLARNCQ